MFSSTVLKDLEGKSIPSYVKDGDILATAEGGHGLTIYLPAIEKHGLKQKHVDKLIAKAKRKWGIAKIDINEDSYFEYDPATNKIK